MNLYALNKWTISLRKVCFSAESLPKTKDYTYVSFNKKTIVMPPVEFNSTINILNDKNNLNCVNNSVMYECDCIHILDRRYPTLTMTIDYDKKFYFYSGMYLKYNSTSDKCTLMIVPGDDWDFGQHAI